MATKTGTVSQPGTWGTFHDVRNHLFKQFQNIPFVPETGISVDELDREIREYLDNHPEQPRVLQKANVFRIVVTRGQIYIDPQDWFADKLNHDGHLDRPIYGDEKSLVRMISVGWSMVCTTC